jgi:hypothetical protein
VDARRVGIGAASGESDFDGTAVVFC